MRFQIRGRRRPVLLLGAFAFIASTMVVSLGRLLSDHSHDRIERPSKVASDEVSGGTRTELVEASPTRKMDVAGRGSESSNDGTHQDGQDTPSDAERDWLDRYRQSEQTIKLGGRTTLLGRADLRRYGGDLGVLISELREPDKKGSVASDGILLDGVRAHSYLAQNYGVRRGDILVSVNGAPIESIRQGVRWASDQPSRKYAIVLRRAGKEVSRVLLVPSGE